MEYKNKWVVSVTNEQRRNDPVVEEISKSLGVTGLTAQLLVNRGCLTPSEAKAFISKEDEQLHDPFEMKDMDKAVDRIVEALENEEKIVIFGDYDVDGVTSVSCLYLYLKSQGADVSYYIPCRSGEGYGMSEPAIRKLAGDGCSLIITVDTGITAVAEAEIASSLGVDLVITDHHECHSELPCARAVVNPKRPDCPYPFKELAGVGVVFKLLCAVEAILHPEDSLLTCVRRVSKEYVDLVAIGTVADVMPICDENRLIVGYGLSLIENTERPGLAKLIEATRGDSKYNTKKKITASFIGYTIAPRINAAGRIRDASLAVELFLAEDDDKAEAIAKSLCEINKERQNEENKIIEQAYARIDMYHDFEKDPIIVLEDESWHHGVIGIVASRITEKYGCPSILISFEGASDEENEEEQFGKGSGRSVKGLNLVENLSLCSELLEKFGGHELAAGLTIKRKNLPEFKKRINQYARERMGKYVSQTQIEVECEVSNEDITFEQANELYALEPFGSSNPVPVFVYRKAIVEDISLVGGGKHTKMSLRIGRSSVNAMYFRQRISDIDLYPGDTADVVFTLDINEFQNQKSLQLLVKDIRMSEGQFNIENSERKLFERISSEEDLNLEELDSFSASAIVPERGDFAFVYNTLKYELKLEHEVFSIRALQHLLFTRGQKIGYVKLRFILMIFEELGFFDITEISTEHEIYGFKYIHIKNKTNLDNSSIYRKLKRDFYRENN